MVRNGKYNSGQYGDELAQVAAQLVRERWQPRPFPTWVTAVPSLRQPNLVADFAVQVAARLRLPFRAALEKAREVPEQKALENSAQQAANVESAFRVNQALILPGAVLLVDDIVDSGWTLTMCGVLLRESGSGIVHPFTLASAARRGP
jgi:ATP-dependent DNA helicase RecQ